MPQKPETYLVGTFLFHLRKLPKSHWVKMHGNQFSGRGHPDIMGCLCGVFVGIEVKRPGFNATPIQQLNIDKINAAGGVAGVVHDIHELGEILEKINKAAKDVAVPPDTIQQGALTSGDLHGSIQARGAHGGASRRTKVQARVH